MADKVDPVSRARLIPGSRVGSLGSNKCPICDHNEWKKAEDVVVANVYFEGHWYDLKVFHTACYLAGGRGYMPEQYGAAGTADEYERVLAGGSKHAKGISIKRWVDR